MDPTSLERGDTWDVVYILKNEAMPGLIKIGYTKENAEKRANELYTTGVSTAI